MNETDKTESDDPLTLADLKAYEVKVDLTLYEGDLPALSRRLEEIGCTASDYFRILFLEDIGQAKPYWKNK